MFHGDWYNLTVNLRFKKHWCILVFLICRVVDQLENMVVCEQLLIVSDKKGDPWKRVVIILVLKKVAAVF